ncbi:MAG: GNAT family N-acetyltransferase [Thermoplasmata archaeon]|nr:GNAT family N-acetyltransferase [Thermoplasmata archaeon]
MAEFVLRELGAETWPDFAGLAAKHRGIWGGCWCLSFHLPPGTAGRTPASNRSDKERLVRAGQAHAALVYDGRDLAGWCQFGSPVELPARMSIYRTLGLAPPRWRITCFFVDRDRRGAGVAAAGLAGALRQIAARGGGTVDGYPARTNGTRVASSFLWHGTASMFEAVGFRRLGPIGTTRQVMRKAVRRG